MEYARQWTGKRGENLNENDENLEYDRRGIFTPFAMAA
jgi:hypothetical protein